MTAAAKNKHAQMLGRRGGQAKTPKKTAAARRNLRKFWKSVKAGDAPKPKVGWPRGRPRKKHADVTKKPIQ